MQVELEDEEKEMPRGRSIIDMYYDKNNIITGYVKSYSNVTASVRSEAYKQKIKSSKKKAGAKWALQTEKRYTF